MMETQNWKLWKSWTEVIKQTKMELKILARTKKGSVTKKTL